MIEVLKQALEALQDLLEQTETPPDKNCSCHIAPPCFDCVDYSGLRYAIKQANDNITSLRQAIQEEALRNVQRIGQEIEQEPVSYQSTQEKGRIETVPAQGGLLPTMREGKDFTITHPPQRTWQGLTHEQVDSWELPDCPTVFEFAQFIEAKLKQKNGFAEEKNT